MSSFLFWDIGSSALLSIFGLYFLPWLIHKRGHEQASYFTDSTNGIILFYYGHFRFFLIQKSSGTIHEVAFSGYWTF